MSGAYKALFFGVNDWMKESLSLFTQTCVNTQGEANLKRDAMLEA